MLEEYDKAWAKYQEGLKIIPVPLVSWTQFPYAAAEKVAFNAIQKNWTEKECLQDILTVLKREVIITDANFEIIFATEGVYQMNGYHPSELIGKSPRIFQGELTSQAVKDKIKRAMSQKIPFKEVLLNYKRNGATYHCEIEAFPKFNNRGTFLNYIAFERIAS